MCRVVCQIAKKWDKQAISNHGTGAARKRVREVGGGRWEVLTPMSPHSYYQIRNCRRWYQLVTITILLGYITKPSQKILSDKEAQWIAASYKEVSLLWYIKSNISYLSNKIINAIRFLDSSSFQKLATQYPRVPLGWFKHKNSVVREEVRDNESVKQNVKYKWKKYSFNQIISYLLVIKTHHIESDFL